MTHASAHPDNPAIVTHLVAFGRVLRRVGLRVGSGHIMDALRAVEAVGIERRDDVYQALFSVFVQRREHIEVFDQAFHLFWHAPAQIDERMALVLPQPRQPHAAQRQPQKRVQQALTEPEAESPRFPRDPKKEVVHIRAAYSAGEALREKDFASFTADEVEAAKAVIRQMRWPVEPMRVRRQTPRAKGRRLHLRRTMQQGLRDVGEFVELHRQGPKRKPRPIVVLCDISGSMEPYTRMLLHFMHAVTEGMQRVESFVFGTRLTRITRYLRRRDVDDALDAVAHHVTDWSGGTRIGEALRDFNYHWLRRVLRSDGVVLLISDGFDRGDPEMLGREMARLHRSCHRLLWLNPLLGYDAYQPLTRGMQAALPHIDDFLPIHNLDALAQLGDVLAATPRRRRLPRGRAT